MLRVTTVLEFGCRILRQMKESIQIKYAIHFFINTVRKDLQIWQKLNHNPKRSSESTKGTLDRPQISAANRFKTQRDGGFRFLRQLIRWTPNFLSHTL